MNDYLMRIALAQLNPTSGDIDGNAARILAAVEAAAPRRRHRRHARDGAPRLLHRRSGRGRGRSSRPTSARCSASPRRRAGITAVVGFIDCDYGGPQRQRHDPQVQRRGGRPRRPRAAARAQVAAAELPLLRRQALLHARRTRASRSTSARPAGRSRRRRVDLRGHVGRVLRRQAAARAGRARAPSVLLNINASPFYPGQAARARRADPPAHRPAPQAARLRQHRRRRRQRQEHHPVRRREPGLRRATARLLAIGRQFAEDLLVVDLDRRAAAAPLELPPRRPRARDLRRAGHGAARLHAEDRLHPRRRRGVGRHRLGAGAGASPSTRSARSRSRPSTCRRSTTPRRPGRSPQRLARGARRQLRRHPDPGRSTTTIRAVFEEHAHPIAQQPHAREPARAHPRAADDGGVERHRRAPHLLRQRDRDRARLRDALRRHVRRHVAHRRPVEDRRLPAVALRQRTHGAEKIPERDVPHRAVRRAGRRISSIRSTTRSSRRSSASWSSAARARPSWSRCSSAARSIRTRFLPDAEGRTVYDKHTPASFRAVVDDASRRMRRSVYKRLQGPPIVVVTERAFGFDLRETIINGWEG